MEDQEKIFELYNNTQKISDNFARFARENYKKEQESKKSGGDGPRKLTDFEKDERTAARRIQREIKRFAATGRISNFLEAQLQKQQNQNYSDNTSESSKAAGSSFEKSAVKIEFTPFPPPKIQESTPRQVRYDPVLSTDIIAHPWKIWLKSAFSGNVNFAVEPSSILYDGINGSEIEVTGLGKENNDYTTLNEDSVYIILLGTVNDGSCDSASIIFDTDWPIKVTFDDEGNQTDFSVVLGQITKNENGIFYVVQNVFSHLTFMNMCINGSPAIYPFPI